MAEKKDKIPSSDDLDNSQGRKKTYKLKKKKDNLDEYKCSSIEQIRERYKQLYLKSNIVEISKNKVLSEDEMTLIEETIKRIEEKVKEMKDTSKLERRQISYDILSELKKIEQYELPIELAEQIYMLMCSKELKGLNKDSLDRTDYYIRIERKKFMCKLVKSIDMKQYEIDSIEELQKLGSKMTGYLLKEDPITVEPVKIKISNKINAIRQQQAIEKMKNDIPRAIELLIKHLAKGELDFEIANAIIDDEASRRAKKEARGKGIFKLTEEQERRKIIGQIRTAITEGGNKYRIKEPEKVVLQMQKLCGGNLGQSITAVAKNLIGRKELKKARELCDIFSIRNKEGQDMECAEHIRCIRDEIKNAEIGNMVMKVITMNGTEKKEKKCFELIKKGLEMGNIELSAISLGKSQDGLRNITLADVWGNDDKKVR